MKARLTPPMIQLIFQQPPLIELIAILPMRKRHISIEMAYKQAQETLRLLW